MDPLPLAQILKDNAEAVQTIVLTVEILDDAFQHAVTITREQQGSSIAAPQLGTEPRRRFERLCREHGITLLSGDLRSHAGSIHTGFTVGDWALADTATLVLDSTSEDVRIATMLTEVHVAVVPRPRIRATAFDLMEELGYSMASPPTYLAFISGASRTADIERVLTIGVHGPQELHLLILEEPPS
jgi:L-lactate dehydrogenase complex protein LldG